MPDWIPVDIGTLRMVLGAMLILLVVVLLVMATRMDGEDV